MSELPTFPSAPMKREDWEQEFLLLMEPLVEHASVSRARIRLPGGRPSSSGPESDSLEAFARSLWMAGPWLSTHPTGEAPIAGRNVDVGDFYRTGFVNGTGERHPDSWFPLLGLRQTLVEAASLAWNLWLARSHLWEPLGSVERRRILAWLEGASAIAPMDNNWRLFSAILHTVLKHLGGTFDQRTIDGHLDRVESFYLGDGWYNDGPLPCSPDCSIDYYNAFVLHPYLLYWSLLDGDSQPERRERILARARTFQRSFVLWFGSDGSFPCFGRSTLYRMGVTHVFASAVLADASALPLGQVRRLCGLVLRRALGAPGALSGERQLTMGFTRELLPMIEAYSGPGSPYWAAKAFGILGLPRQHEFWQAPEDPLPIEQSDYVVAVPAAGFLVRGDRDTGHVQIVNGKSFGYPKKYSNITYSSHFGYEIDAESAGGERDRFGEAGLTLSRDGRVWHPRRSIRELHVGDNLLVTEAVYRLGSRPLARTAEHVSRALSAERPAARTHPRRAKSWLSAQAHAIYRWMAAKLTPRAKVLTAVMFVGDQQVRAHRVTSRVKVLAREGGFACGWSEDAPDLLGGSLSYVGTKTAASGIKPLLGYDRAPVPRRGDHNVLHVTSCVPHVETSRPRRGVVHLVSVSVARPIAFAVKDVGRGIGDEPRHLIALLETAARRTGPLRSPKAGSPRRRTRGRMTA
jgi:hypothetical protein